MEVFGLAMSFYIIGGLIGALMIPTWMAMRRAGLSTPARAVNPP
jgi:hypothetical protein